MRTFLCLFASLIFFNFGYSQNSTHENHEHHDHHDHANHRYELGIANAPVYFVKEKELAYGLHAHLIKFIGNRRFGVGLGYERIFDEHKHQTFGIVGNYNVMDQWFVNLSPGITIENNNWNIVNFAFHIETSYEFELGNFHLGPVLEWAYDPEDIHISLGLHIGIGF